MKNGEKLKSSCYNFILNPKGKGCILYNSLSGAIISVTDPEELRKVQDIVNRECVCYEEADETVRILYDNGILVEKEKDELEYLQFLYEREVVRDQELSLTLITTRQCNLRCVYCYEKHENLVMSEQVYHNLELYIEQSLKNREYSGVSITLFGGEPFLEYEQIVCFLGKVQKLCDTYHASYGVGATSNGVLIYPERFEKLCQLGVNYYQITIDGLETTHDMYRKSLDKRGSFQKIIENLSYMNSTDHDFEVTIRTNFNEEVFRNAREFYQFIAENFDERFHVYYEGIKKLGGENDEALDVLDAGEVSETSVDIAEYIRELGIKNDVVDEMTLPFHRVCYATKHNDYLIDYDGSVLKCTLSLDDDRNRIGRICDDGIMEIDEVKHARWVGKKTQLSELCKTCRVLPLCYGGRCVNDRVHGEAFSCDRELQEKELAELIPYNV